MRWHDLLFLHWPVSASALRPHIPAGLELDTRDGSAWLGVVPFRMSGVAPRFVPPIPGLSAFPEINLRTYVTADGKPGVWFFSLDVTSALAVWVARTRFHLPYFRARMQVKQRGGTVHYSSTRLEGGAAFVGEYRPTGDVFRAEPGSLEEFLTERYCLYSANAAGELFRGDIHHEPWPLQPAEARVSVNTLADSLGVSLQGVEPLAHFARNLQVIAWNLQRVG